jgi:hypothetical protein
LVSRERREVAGVRDAVTLGSGVQARTRGVFALARGTAANITAELAHGCVGAQRRITIADGPIAIGHQLICVDARQIPV